MGQTQHKTNTVVNEWNLVDMVGKIEVYKNQNNQLAERHVVMTDPKIQENDYITAYHKRYLPNKPIVNAYDAHFQSAPASMCQNNSTITVYTEYIPHRLSNVKTLNHGQGMYVLCEALAGFSELYGRVGPFQIHEDLIGFNQQGEVRVWYNPNFADNTIDNDRIILMSTINPYDFDRKFSQNQQHDMVEDTINAVVRYTKFHPKFLQQAEMLKKMGFSEARRIISNQIERKAYYVPDHLFLSDRNDIIKKSGIQLKHKHVFNPNKPRKGQRYPYFYEQNNQANQPNYLYGQYPYANYYGQDYDNDYNDDYSQTSESDVEINGQGGYYNLNGQNYRVIATREYEGNQLNEQAIIDQVLRNNHYQPQVYSPNPGYSHVRTKTDQYPVQYRPQPNIQAQPQVFRKPKPKYQEGHIVINEDQNQTPEFSYVNPNQYPQYQQQVPQQTVRVFSIGEDDRLVQQGRPYQPHNSPQFVQKRTIPSPQVRVVNSQYQPDYRVGHSLYQPNQRFSHANNSTVYPVNLTNQYPQRKTPLPQNLTHRHKIFEPIDRNRMVRESSSMHQQRAF